MISPLPGATPTKPGTATLPFFGVDPIILDAKGKECAPNQRGKLMIKKPWPSMLRGVYGDRNRFIETYWSEEKGMYFVGDSALKDEDGNTWIIGRLDDVLNVSGHRLGTAEIESALVSHNDVVEAAVIGKPDEIKGEGIVAFVITHTNTVANDELQQALKAHVVKTIGAIARPDHIYLVPALPKTRSGKIMRRLLKELINTGKVSGNTTTLEDPNVIVNIQQMIQPNL